MCILSSVGIYYLCSCLLIFLLLLHVIFISWSVAWFSFVDSNYSPVRICSAIHFPFISHPGCVQMIGGIANYDQFKCCLVSLHLPIGNKLRDLKFHLLGEAGACAGCRINQDGSWCNKSPIGTIACDHDADIHSRIWDFLFSSPTINYSSRSEFIHVYIFSYFVVFWHNHYLIWVFVSVLKSYWLCSCK